MAVKRKIALYCSQVPGHTTGYFAEDGCFVGSNFERLGAVGIFQVDFPDDNPRYRFEIFENPNALQGVLPALQALDQEARVIYLGTFSQVLFPGLRLGYLVVPADLVDAFSAAHFLAGQYPRTLEQMVLADFITEGHFAGHIRRMRTLYAERQAVLVTAAQRALAGFLDIRPAEAGMHLIGWLPSGVDDHFVARQAADAESTCRPYLCAS